MLDRMINRCKKVNTHFIIGIDERKTNKIKTNEIIRTKKEKNHIDHMYTRDAILSTKQVPSTQ